MTPRDFASESELQFRARFRVMEDAILALMRAASDAEQRAYAAEQRAARMERALRRFAKLRPARERQAMMEALDA